MAVARYGDVDTARGGIQMITEILRNKRLAAESQKQQDNAVLVAAAESGLYLDADSGVDLMTQYRDANRIRNDFGTAGESGLKGFLNPLDKPQMDPYPASLGKQEQTNAIDILNSMLDNDPRTEALRVQTFGDKEGAALEFDIRNAIVGLQSNKTFKTATEEAAYHVSQVQAATPGKESANENINVVKDMFAQNVQKTKGGKTQMSMEGSLRKKIRNSLKQKMGERGYKNFISEIAQKNNWDADIDDDEIFEMIAQQLIVSPASDFVEMIYGRPDKVMEFIAENPNVPMESGINIVAEHFPKAIIARTMLNQLGLLNDINVLTEYNSFIRYQDILEGQKIRASVDWMYKESERKEQIRKDAKNVAKHYTPTP